MPPPLAMPTKRARSLAESGSTTSGSRHKLARTSKRSSDSWPGSSGGGAPHSNSSSPPSLVLKQLPHRHIVTSEQSPGAASSQPRIDSATPTLVDKNSKRAPGEAARLDKTQSSRPHSPVFRVDSPFVDRIDSWIDCIDKPLRLSPNCDHPLPDIHAPPPPLTRENLALLESLSSPDRMPRQAAAGDGLEVITHSNASWDRIRAHGMDCDENREMPDLLRQYVDGILKAPRPGSPPQAAKGIAEDQLSVARLKETEGIDELADRLLFDKENHGSNGMKWIIRRSGTMLHGYKQTPLYGPTTDKKQQLETARPDHLVGYITQKDAQDCSISSLFTRKESMILSETSPTREALFPFLTAQWKAPATKGTMHEARAQAARDGATIGNYLQKIFQAGGVNPTVVQTSHVSVLCDLYTVYVYIHWRWIDEDDNVCYAMEEVDSAFLRKENEVVRILNILRNLYDYAIGERFRGLRGPIDAIVAAKMAGRVLLDPVVPTSTNTLSASRSNLTTSSRARSNASNVSKKRKLQATNNGEDSTSSDELSRI